MDYRKINDILRDIGSLRNKKIETIQPQYEGDSIHYEICSTDKDDIFVKIQISTDSYGGSESITGIEFVKPVEKRVYNYEPIN